MYNGTEGVREAIKRTGYQANLVYSNIGIFMNRMFLCGGNAITKTPEPFRTAFRFIVESDDVTILGKSEGRICSANREQFHQPPVIASMIAIHILVVGIGIATDHIILFCGKYGTGTAVFQRSAKA